MTALINVGNFLASLAFSLLCLLLILRLLLHAFNASNNNPVNASIAAISNPLILPLRKLLPRFRTFCLATLLVLLVVDIIKYQILLLFMSQPLLSLAQLCYVVPCDIIMQINRVLFISIIAYVILSWVAPHLRNPFTDVISTLALPPIRLGRLLISNKSGFDFGPLVAIIFLYIIQIIITSYIPSNYFF